MAQPANPEVMLEVIKETQDLPALDLPADAAIGLDPK